jgi:hypothetical protein
MQKKKGKPELDWEETKPEAGKSTTLEQRKGKKPITRSLRKQPDALIVFSYIPYGVQETPNLLGCVERL